MMNEAQVVPAIVDLDTIPFRKDGRAYDEKRSISVLSGVFPQAAASVLFSMGNTQVLCAISITKGVPLFKRGTGEGWLTAEYSLLPASTGMRNMREATMLKRNSRSVELSRLIGRVLRAAVDLQEIGEYTIHIDCDVLNADGGTRAAAITGSCYALFLAQEVWLKNGTIKKEFLIHSIAAVSVGLLDDIAFLDLNCEEDQSAEADFTFVFNKFGDIIEIQGTAERKPVSWKLFEELRACAIIGISSIFADLDNVRESGAHASRTNSLGIHI
jgi:ribonuclease PH